MDGSIDSAKGRTVRIDAALYGAAAVYAALAARFWENPLLKEWAFTAVWGYLGGVALAGCVGLFGGRLSGSRRQALRVGTVAMVLVVATLWPLIHQVMQRSQSGPAAHAQSETILVEEAARELVAGRDPYASEYLDGPLRTWPLGVKTHFPYLPALLPFGLPRAFGADGVAGDARVWLTTTTLLVALAALAMARVSAAAAIRGAQVLLVLPTTAAPIAGGGNDVTVLALMVLALVLIHRRRPVGGGLVLGLAASMKLTAWPLIPFLVLAARRQDGAPGRRTALAACIAVIVPIGLPFLLWGPSAFWEDVILYPLGLGQQPTLAEGPTLGALLRDVFPGAGLLLAATSLALVAGTGLYLALRRPAATAPHAAIHAAVVLTVAILLATAGRFGYLAYPMVLGAWAVVVLRDRSAPARVGPD